METKSISKSEFKSLLSANYMHTLDYTDGFATNIADVYELNEKPGGYLLIYHSMEDLTKELIENANSWDPMEGADDQYYDYNPSCLEAIIYAFPKIKSEDQEIIMNILIPKLTAFINDEDQDDDMRTTYKCTLDALNQYSTDHDPAILNAFQEYIREYYFQ